MKTPLRGIYMLVVVTIAFAACSPKRIDTESITQRIQYDVSIKSPDAGYDWWVNNIEGKNREALINDLMQAAYNGKVKTFDAFLFTENKPDQVRKIGSFSDTLRVQRSVPPYEFYDTVVTRELSIHDISRLRFLEEWSINPQNMQIHKNVIGIAPLLESYDESGILRGYMPMFWVFFDENYPAALSGRLR